MSIFVDNLSDTITECELALFFASYGTVTSIQLPTDRKTGRFRGFAFVALTTMAEETAAIKALNQSDWIGRDLYGYGANLDLTRPLLTSP